jgi:ADP-ribosyl-[dinitrogen reductase] hydrolase
MTDIPLRDRYRGSFIGLAMGDTLGMPLEFKSPNEFEPLTKPEAGGPFDLPLGYWTDDTSMALCLADSILEKKGYDSYDVMDKYWAWSTNGYRSSIGTCFDIGNQTSSSLNEYMSVGSAVISKDKERLSAAGNGTIMRLAPLVIASHAADNTLEKTMELARISGRETHYSYLAEEGTALFGAMLFNAFEAKGKQELWDIGSYELNGHIEELLGAVKVAQAHTVASLEPTGYVLNSLVCATWAFLNNDTFESGALAAVNLGGDADTIGAIYGQLAGAYYGAEAIPADWRAVLFQESEISRLATELSEFKMCEILRTRFEEDAGNYTTEYEIETLKADITSLKVDAIVNAANKRLLGGSGVCGAIFNAAGYDEMTAACQAIGLCDYGDAVLTPGFKLPAKNVIHTVGPIFGQHAGNEPDILQSCYWESLRLAHDHRLKSIAFPMISTGIYGYPKDEATKIAFGAIKSFFEDNPHTSVEKVILVAYSQYDYDLLKRLS